MPLIAKDGPDDRRSKVDPMTGEERTKQPTWTPEQRAEIGALGTLAMQHGKYDAFAAHWRFHKYTDPVDTIHLTRELLKDLGITVPPGTSEE